jgi:hypothetical protein
MQLALSAAHVMGGTPQVLDGTQLPSLAHETSHVSDVS